MSPKEDKRARKFAAIVGASAASVAALWGAYVSFWASQGVDVEEIRAKQKEKYFCARIAVEDAGIGADTAQVLCAKVKHEEIKAGMFLGKPVHKFCGTIKERKQKCPEHFDDSNTVVACNGASVLVPFARRQRAALDAGFEPCKDYEREDGQECVVNVCDEGVAEDGGSGCYRMKYTFCLGGINPDGQPCDMQAPGCVDWPSRVSAGDDPDEIANQDTPDGG